jgi:hypothetical protein
MNTNERFLGIVQDGRLHILLPERSRGTEARLTSMGMQAAMPPEMQEIDLAPHEEKALMVEGHDGGGWIYSAQVIDEAGPILTAVVRRLFASEAH